MMLGEIDSKAIVNCFKLSRDMFALVEDTFLKKLDYVKDSVVGYFWLYGS